MFHLWLNIYTKLKHAKSDNNGIEEARLRVEQEIHHRKAEAGRKALEAAVELAKENSNIHVITFDLEQALPTPKLTTGPCFYKRKLWCYNLNIHNCVTNTGYLFMWDESTAKRGADEIASCLLRYFTTYDVKGDILYAITYNCGGQIRIGPSLAFGCSLFNQEDSSK